MSEFWSELARRDADHLLTDQEHTAMISAEENAGMTGDERGYADFSPEWYKVFEDSYRILTEM
jgi:hypothetical protein